MVEFLSTFRRNSEFFGLDEVYINSSKCCGATRITMQCAMQSESLTWSFTSDPAYFAIVSQARILFLDPKPKVGDGLTYFV